MQFRLTYEGPLYSSQSKQKGRDHVHDIRCQLHAQLKDLWSQQPLSSHRRWWPRKHGPGRLTMVGRLLAVTLLIWSSPAGAATIAGRASVIDGDTLEIHGERIRILDVDAPESRQTCTKPDGTEWRCGQQAALALSSFVGGYLVTCDSDKLDRYQRHLARCSMAGHDVGEWLASNGWVVPYRKCKCETIRSLANRAKGQQVGIWASEFQMPWDWRKAH